MRPELFRRLLPDVRGLPRAFLWLWLGAFVNKVGGFVVPFLALYLTNDRGMSVEEAGIVVSLYGLGSVGSGPIGGALTDRLGRRATLAIATVLGALAMLALGFARTTESILGAAVLLGVCGDL